jgi:hypothetical protein
MPVDHPLRVIRQLLSQHDDQELILLAAMAG